MGFNEQEWFAGVRTRLMTWRGGMVVKLLRCMVEFRFLLLYAAGGFETIKLGRAAADRLSCERQTADGCLGSAVCGAMLMCVEERKDERDSMLGIQWSNKFDRAMLSILVMVTLVSAVALMRVVHLAAREAAAHTSDAAFCYAINQLYAKPLMRFIRAINVSAFALMACVQLSGMFVHGSLTTTIAVVFFPIVVQLGAAANLFLPEEHLARGIPFSIFRSRLDADQLFACSDLSMSAPQLLADKLAWHATSEEIVELRREAAIDSFVTQCGVM